MKSVTKVFHNKMVYSRRMTRLSELISPLLKHSKNILDVGCGDGKSIPYPDDSFDTVLIIDVLHHTDDPCALVAELARVSSRYVIIKDHVRWGGISYIKLRMMDYVGNAHYHVRLPCNYQTNKQWKILFHKNKLKPVKIQRDLKLYTGIFHFLFDEKLHFIAVLEKERV